MTTTPDQKKKRLLKAKIAITTEIQAMNQERRRENKAAQDWIASLAAWFSTPFELLDISGSKERHVSIAFKGQQ